MARLNTARKLWLFSFIVLCHGQSDDAWTNLNVSVNGRLYLDAPLALPCYSLYNGYPVPVDEASCDEVRVNYATNSFRVDRASAYMNLQDETCFSDPSDQCLLDNTVSPAGIPLPGSSCNSGSIPSHHIEIETATDVQAAFEFAKQYNISLVIKNSGHDYLNRNSQKGALSLWVHKLHSLSYHDNFVPEGCVGQETVGPAMTVGAGVSTQDVLEFASRNNATFVTGYSPTIAVSGGWVQGGGHSVLSPAFGLGADRVVEFKIVTPDGILRTANAYEHSDLFWALRGGGGGTFGVVLEATHQVEPAGPVAAASITLPSNITADTALKWIELVAKQSVKWGKQGWGGHVGGTYLTYMNPLLNDTGTAQSAMQAVTDFATAIGGSSTVEILPEYFDVWNNYVLPGALKSAGQIRLLASRLIPQSLFESDEGISKIMKFITDLQAIGYDPLKFYSPVGSPFLADLKGEVDRKARRSVRDSYGTSVTPAWYSSLWTIGNGLGVPWNSSYTQRLKALTQLREATRLGEELTGADGGTYFNEANPFMVNWRESWWGEHYPALLKIKEKYDPANILKCWKCIGFEDEDIESERFRCHGKLQLDLDALSQ